MSSSLSGNWSVGMREILRQCYTHYGLDAEEYIQADPEDTRERSILPSDLNPDTYVNPWQDWQQEQQPIVNPLPPTPQQDWQRMQERASPNRLPTPAERLTSTPKGHRPSRKRAREEPYDPYKCTPLVIRRPRRY